jgi:RasGEF domain
VKRLKHSWSSLSAADERMYEAVSKLCSLGENYKEYRSLLRDVDEKYHYVVYFGGLLRDLTFIDEASNFVEDHKINWKKMTLIADVLISVERSQTAHFGPTTLDETVCQDLFRCVTVVFRACGVCDIGW